MVFGKKKPDLSDIEVRIAKIEAILAALKQRIEQLELNFSLVIESSGTMIRKLQGTINKLKSQVQEEEPSNIVANYKKKIAEMLLKKVKGE